MAEDGMFQPIGDDTIKGISPAGIVGRFAPRIQEERGQSSQGESNLPLPGILISWLGHNRPETAGEVDRDDGQITMLIQLVDRLDRTPGDTGLESYFRWLVDIREALQENPYRSLCNQNGEIYLVHVSEKIAPDNRAYLNDEARLALQINLFTRTRRDRRGNPHGT
jgi:hypothetical protein